MCMIGTRECVEVAEKLALHQRKQPDVSGVEWGRSGGSRNPHQAHPVWTGRCRGERQESRGRDV